MKPQFKTLFTENPSDEAITELLDYLNALAAACDSQHLFRLLRHNQEQRDLNDPKHSQTTPRDQ